MIVEKTKNFNLEFIGLMMADRKKVAEFIFYVEQHGLTGLPGRNKKSDHVPPPPPNHDALVEYAQRYKLWHYHAGFPSYRTDHGLGNYTSEGVIHYQRFPDRIRLVSITNHRSFRLSKENTFERLFYEIV